MNDRMICNILREALTPEEREQSREFIRGKRSVFLSVPFDGTNLDECMDMVWEIGQWAGKQNVLVFSPVMLMYVLDYLPQSVLSDLTKTSASVMIDSCEETWFCGDRTSHIMQNELKYAAEHGKRLRYVQKRGNDYVFVGGGIKND